MSETVQAYNSATGKSVQLPLNDVPQVFAYLGGFLITITVVYAGVTYVQTFTNNGTNITAISAWVSS